MSSVLSLDVGEKRIGVAVADSVISISIPLDTIEVDGTELSQIAELVLKNDVSTIVVGNPRNQQGEETAQTKYVLNFIDELKFLEKKIVLQDESMTSVIAEDQLRKSKKPYSKGDIDAVAASIILTDYLEAARR